MDDHVYAQSPFEDITKEEYDLLSKSLHAVDLSQIIEPEDDTVVQETVACGGGACEVR
jgi:hypothetical protein